MMKRYDPYASFDTLEMDQLDAKEFIMIQTRTAYERLNKYFEALVQDIETNHRGTKDSWIPWTNYCYKICLSCLRLVKKNNTILVQIGEPAFPTKNVDAFLRKYKENYDHKKTGNEQAHRQKIREQRCD